MLFCISVVLWKLINFIRLPRKELDKDINKKIAENEEFVRYTFFELKVRHNLSEDEIDEVLRLARNKFENLGYRVYFTGAKYNYQGENRIVESNEYLVAIKGL